MRLNVLLREARSCDLCAHELPFGPSPLIQGSVRSRIVIIGQAPGAAAHKSGTPWDDRSGQRLREWLGVDDTVFYDADRIALLPMGLCYPGRAKTGDAAPIPRCAPTWHPRLLPALTGVRLTVFVGRYAFGRYLAEEFESLTDAVAGHESLLPKRIALPHPSPRNNIWLKQHGWFERDAIPKLRRRVREVLQMANRHDESVR